MAKPRTAAGRAKRANELLDLEYPDAECELDHKNAYELLSATILSAQCTDVRVNKVTPALFERYPTPNDLAQADLHDVEELVHTTGFYRNKSKSLVGMAQAVMAEHGGEVPSDMKSLVKLPGVGRKTANVLRSVVFELPGLPVDTHVKRLSHLLDLTKHQDPVKIEMELNPMVAALDRGNFSLRLILHGRRVCVARRPRCDECVLASFCPGRSL